MNDAKREAVYHGRKRAFLKGDWVYVTQLPAFDHRLGQIDDIRDSLFPYLVRLDNGDQYGAFDWLALTPVENQIPNPDRETTGEHIFHKLGDDLYQDWDGSKNPAFPLTAGQAADWASRDPEGYFAAVRADAEARMRPKVDHWTPTVGQLGLALGIIMTIILIFVFVVIFYRW